MKQQQRISEVWVIVHKSTGQHWATRKGKKSWNKPGHAKNSWHIGYAYSHQEISEYFDDQDEYVLEQIADTMDYKKMWEQLKEQLEPCVSSVLACSPPSKMFTTGYNASYAKTLSIIKELEEQFDSI